MGRKRAVGDLAEVINRHVERGVRFHTAGEIRAPHYATVLDVNPWKVELHDGEVLDDEQIVATQWVEHYHLQFVVDVGDTAIVTEMHDGMWMLHDVVSEKDLSP